MRHARISLITAAVAAITLGACASTFTPDPHARAPVLDGFGTVAMRVTTSVPAAQDAFSRGLLQAYAFNHVEAERTFKSALAQDPHCAMCAWGVAYVLGPNINRTERGDLREARKYVALAKRNAANASARELALIDALAARYGEQDGKAQAPAPAAADICSSASSKKNPLDVLYAGKMRALADAYPADPDITVLYAEAHLIATDEKWRSGAVILAAPGIADVTKRLETALAQTPNHPGLNHYLIHAVDHSPQPQRAVAAADRLGKIAPESPHLLHMPSHIYVRVARYDDAVRVNTEALAAQVRQTRKVEAQGFGKVDDWNFHNTHFLWYAAVMDGRGELALEQARRLEQRGAKGEALFFQYMRSLPMLTLLRFERWGDVLKQPAPGGAPTFDSAVAHYARGVVLARQGDKSGAAAEAKALAAIRATPAFSALKVGQDPVTAFADIMIARLDAEIAAAGGDIAQARSSLERGIALEDAVETNEPPLLASGSQLALGDLLLRAGRWQEAAQVFHGALEANPGSGWALRGLHGALAGAGSKAEAAQVRAELARAWSRADSGLRPST